MVYSQKLRKLFPGITLHAEDLLLLETFQIRYLPDRVAAKEFATLIREYPVVHRFLVTKYPPISSFITRILEEHKPADDKNLVEEYCQEALWEIADQIIYNKHPELFDALAPVKWNIEEITSVTSLEGKVVADVGAGSGRIAFLVAPFAQSVFAVEPVSSFRSFMREKAVSQRVVNLYVLDGTLDSIPLPDHSLDVLITSNAIGWNLTEELIEIERVIKPGGHAIHLLRSENKQDNPFHDILVSSSWNYTCLQGGDEKELRFRYIKKIKSVH
ncbi:MAG: class I SAM-dependent methyltransferase [Bacteroidota bacterium]